MQTCRQILIILCCCFGILFQATGQGSVEPKIVSFPSGEGTLQGYLWVPPGEGPFPAVIWNYGHAQRLLKQGPPSNFAGLAKLYVDRNFVFFIPDRAGKPEDQDQEGQALQPKLAREMQAKNQDIIAALSWLRQQSFVIATKVALSGSMTGAVQALLAAERDSTIAAVVLFSPGVMTWNENAQLREMIQKAVKRSDVPIFLIQPQNDHTLAPSKNLGSLLAFKGGLNRSKVYLPYGKDTRQFAKEGMKIWGKDVLAFLDAAIK